MSMNKKILIAIAGFLFIGLITLVYFTANRGAPADAPSPTPSAANTLEVQKVEELSRSFLATYYTYTNSKSAEYINSIKPYLEPKLASRVQEENARLSQSISIKCSTDRLTVTPNGAGAEAEAVMTCTEPGAEPYAKTVKLYWAKVGNRLQITEIELLESTKRYPYLEK